MTTLVSGFLTVFLPLAVTAPPPSKVKPGWLAFWVVMAMLAAVVLLGISLNKHLKRVNFIEEPDPGERRREDQQAPGPSGPA